jgi:hypothetical protein
LVRVRDQEVGELRRLDAERRQPRREHARADADVDQQPDRAGLDVAGVAVGARGEQAHAHRRPL